MTVFGFRITAALSYANRHPSIKNPSAFANRHPPIDIRQSNTVQHLILENRPLKLLLSRLFVDFFPHQHQDCRLRHDDIAFVVVLQFYGFRAQEQC